jgi:hypothetical protein
VNTTRPSELLRERALSNYTDYLHGDPTLVEQNSSEIRLMYLRQINTQGNMSLSPIPVAAYPNA